MAQKYIEFKSPSDLDLLRLSVEMQDLEYRPLDKKSVGKLTVTLTTPKISYLYGDMRMTGIASVSDAIPYKVDDPSQIRRITKDVFYAAQNELRIIMSEIKDILKNNLTVKISLDDTLVRIMNTIHP